MGGPDRYELRSDARRFETWENNYAARLGLGVAIDYALAIGMEAIEERSHRLADLLRVELRCIPGVTIHDLGPRPAAIVTCSIAGVDAAAAKAYLARAGTNVTASNASSTLLDALARKLPTVLRASPHYYNTEDELRAMIREVNSLSKKKLIR